MVRGVREFRDDFRDDRRREEERSDSRREDQRREEMMRALEEGERQRREDERRMDALRTIVNDDSIEISNDQKKIINDPEMKMMENGEIVKRRRGGLGTGAFADQFSQLRGKLPAAKKKIRKKARKELDRLQSQAFKEANRLLRTKSGQLRKGITQTDVAKKAQKILKRLRKQ